jgi:hypothetical protein
MPASDASGIEREHVSLAEGDLRIETPRFFDHAR